MVASTKTSSVKKMIQKLLCVRTKPNLNMSAITSDVSDICTNDVISQASQCTLLLKPIMRMT